MSSWVNTCIDTLCHFLPLILFLPEEEAAGGSGAAGAAGGAHGPLNRTYQ